MLHLEKLSESRLDEDGAPSKQNYSCLCAPAFNQGTKAWQRPVIVALSCLVVAFTAALLLSAALTRYPLAAGGVLGHAYGQG